jgi:hypothetical protein
MQLNVGTIDRAARVIIGAALLYFLPSPWRWIGVVPIATALVGWCPLYMPFRFSTRGR